MAPPLSWTKEVEGTLRGYVTQLKQYETEATELGAPKLAESLRKTRAALHCTWGELLAVPTNG